MNIKLYLNSKKNFLEKVSEITSIVDKKNEMVFTGITKDNKTITVSYREV